MSKFFGTIAVVCLLNGLSLGAGGAKPNVILIMADDLGYSDIGCYGGEIKTPHLNRLASEGMRFRNFYNNAKCTTTRASLMSGRYPERHGSNKEMITDRTFTLAQAMKKAGYRTILSGKWHLGGDEGLRPRDRGFDEFFGLLGGAANHFAAEIYRHNEKPVAAPADGFYTTDAFTDHALSEIKKSLDSDQPYFLYLAYTAPHYPLHASPEDIAKYEGRYAEGWEALRNERYKRMIDLGVIDQRVKLSATDPDAKPWLGDAERQRLMEVHAAMVDRMDQQIGRVLKLLDETETADNTMVIFLSDNGATFEDINRDAVSGSEIGTRESYRSHGYSWGNALNTPFRKHKCTGHEGGMCTPCIVRWPAKVAANSWSNSIGHVIDFQPTLMSVAGLDPVADIPAGKSPLHGESLLSVFQGEERKRAQPVYMEWIGNRGMRDGDWKLAYLRSVGRWELFNLAVDRTEMNDLSETHPEKLQDMVNQWKGWAAESGFDPEHVLPWEK